MFGSDASRPKKRVSPAEMIDMVEKMPLDRIGDELVMLRSELHELLRPRPNHALDRVAYALTNVARLLGDIDAKLSKEYQKPERTSVYNHDNSHVPCPFCGVATYHTHRWS